MTKEIQLTKGMVTIVDDENYEILSKYKWHYTASNLSKKQGYAGRRVFDNNHYSHIVLLHHYILPRVKDLFIDHINGNSLDNRKCNLRYCSIIENNWNSRKTIGKNPTSKYKGVCWSREKNKWRASAYLNNKQTHLGYFSDEVNAALAYNDAIISVRKEFAWLNRI